MKILLAAASACALALPAFAGEMIMETTDGKKAVVEPCPPVARLLVRASSSYTFESDFEDHDDASGDAWSNEFDLAYRIRLCEGWPNMRCGEWNLRLGARYTRHDFSHDGGLPIPNHLQGAAGVIALEYLVQGFPAILLETRPGFYFENDVDSDHFDAPTTIGATFLYTNKFILFGGATYGGLRKYPILPVVGFIWRINDRLSLNAIYPSPQLVYKCSENFEVYAGGEIVYGAFRVDEAKGRPGKLDNGVLEYTEYRAGVGVRVGNGTFTGELGAGWTFEREFDFHRAEKAYRTDEGAAYIKAELRAAF